MPIYQPDLADMRFVLHEVFPGEDSENFAPDLLDEILAAAGQFTAEQLFPLNQSGDAQGCKFENGIVRTPEGFREAYAAYCEGGWPGMAAGAKYGGQDVPHAAAVLIEEMMCSANMSFGLYPGLTHGAYLALAQHGSDELKAEYLPKMVSGAWTGTMCLTEPQCGTDLGLLRTKAVPQADGSYKLSGSKLFISAGEHDLAENIIHLVLARLPDAPAGVKGISLFLVPKMLHGSRNNVVCTGIEHKMGLKASATCALAFEEATGWLVGAPHKGLAAMFTMMNSERLSVGIQGLGVGVVAYQNAVAYARERLQGRALSGAKYPDKPADPIMVHGDVRRMLLTMRATLEGCRALAGWVARALDKAQGGDAAAEEFCALMTPVIKAFFTDAGFEAASLAVQCYGGHGYITDNGVEQYMRDARIAMIYEGTNGVQAMDLAGRKLPQEQGRLMTRFLDPVLAFCAAETGAEMAPYTAPLAQAVRHLQAATAKLMQHAMSDPEELGTCAADYLRLFGLTALGFMWARMARLALGRNEAFYAAKRATARFFLQRLVPQTGALAAIIAAGGRNITDFPDAAF